MAEPQSISSLFSDVLGSTDYAATQLEADRKLGEQLQTGSAATLFAPERARRLTKSLGGIVGADTRSPAEIKAEQTKKMVSKAMQSAMAQYPTSRALQLEAVAKELMANGMTAEASKFRDAAQASQLQEAKIYSEQAKGFASEQAGLKSQAQATTEDVTRAGKLLKQNEELALLSAQVSTEEVKKLAQEANITETEARTRLVESEQERYDALTPLEIIKTNTEIAENVAQERLNTAKLAEVGSTDFLREVAAADLTDEQEKELIRKRLQARASTGGVSGYDPSQGIAKARLDQMVDIAQSGIESQGSLGRIEQLIGYLPDASTGKFSGTEAFLQSWFAAAGFSDASETIANEMFRVIRGELLLDKASALKGALSDKDLAFLETTLPNLSDNPQSIITAFSSMAADHFADVEAAREMDRIISKTEGKDLQKIDVNNLNQALRIKAKAKYLIKARQSGKYFGPPVQLTEDDINLLNEYDLLAGGAA